MSDLIISCENLVKIFKVADLEVVALQGLDLTVQRGEMMGIVGASGSGKSTLMNVLGGLVRPSAGQVMVDGHDLLKMSNAALNRYRREEVGFVWQQGSRNIIPYLNGQENVELPMILAGVGGRQVRQRGGELLELVDLADRKKYYIGQLSGGEQQRVAVAVALANSPSILLADEPTGELDSETALSVYKAFQTLNQELGVTILIVSHDPGLARHVHRVMAIRDGKVASETRRKPNPKVEHPEGHPDELPHEEHFEELVLLDSAGRLQVPKAYRAALNIQGRVRMEMVDGGVLIRPVEADGQEIKPGNDSQVQAKVQIQRGIRGWLDKWKRK